MRLRAEKYDVGVIVARFQVPNLHPGHRELIQHVCDAHDKVIVVLGNSPLINTVNNPLDFEARRQMVADEFPHINILYAMDMQDDGEWSKALDKLISGVVTPTQSVVLYGSRDSFIKHYTGKLPTQELESETVFSGSVVRKEISRRSTKGTEDFRAGVVWASQSRFATAFQTVDVAIMSDDYSRLLLGRKPGVVKYQFVGGFSDPRSESLEIDALREGREETGLELRAPQYIGSTLIDDWRYRSEIDKIKTAFFLSKVLFGSPRPDDDIEELRWFDFNLGPTPPDRCQLDSDTVRANKFIMAHLLPAHKPLLVMLWDYLNQKEA